MEFKPNFWKVILSLIGGLIVIPFLFGLIIELTTNNAEIQGNSPMIIAIIGIFLIYIIWSLLQKNR
ncbi:hypothetical protein KAJ87_02055 [Candidatus Pacearchaeota archaeon]|nr:hypothetical protein [Candidatus Pacearchaeota archaeon]